MGNKWTLEKEEYTDSYKFRRCVVVENGKQVFELWQLDDKFDNAARIVEEHNALAGIEDVAGFMDAQRKLLESILSIKELWLPDWRESVAPEHAGEAMTLSLMNNKIKEALALFPKEIEVSE